MYLLFSRANSSYCSTPEESSKIREDALAQLEPLFHSVSQVKLGAFMIKAQLLTGQGRGTEAIQTLDDMVKEDQRRRKLPIVQLLDRSRRAMERGDFFEFERAQDQLSTIRREWSGPEPDLLPDQVYLHELAVLRCEAFAAEKQWTKAMDTYQELLQGRLKDDNMPDAGVSQLVFLGIARCCYHLGRYDHAIYASETAIKMHRHFPDVYKHKALSERAKGDLDAAIHTMNQAVLYETPWDDHHMKAVQSLYYELLAERDASRQEFKE